MQRGGQRLQDQAAGGRDRVQHADRARAKALTRRLQAPLQKHLDCYLQLLFPSGRLEVDENMVPGALTHPDPRGPETSDFETLSFGARQQMVSPTGINRPPPRLVGRRRNRHKPASAESA